MEQVNFHQTYRPEIANPLTSPFYEHTLVIPDTCFDMIFIQNYNTGVHKTLFVGLNNSHNIDSWSEQDTNISVFAIRFNFWTMNIISKYPMTKTLNQVIDPYEIFPAFKNFSISIFSVQKFQERIFLAEQYLSSLLDLGNISAPFFNGVDFMIKKNGVGTLKQLAEFLCYSERQTQRIFVDAIGITPKHMMNLVRYQSIWQKMLSSYKMDYSNAVYKYGYADQSHFISDFKKYHSLTPKEALDKVINKK